MFGAIEAGGTKFVCGIGSGPEDLVTAQIPTTSPEETIAAVVRFFHERAGSRLGAVGIGSFGPVDLDPSSPSYGCITSTPKERWSNFNIMSAVRAALNVPVGFDTDVNAAVLAEARWGAARDGAGRDGGQGHLTDFIYLTIGTGIGGGAMVGGEVLHGLVHPEMGHLRIPHDLINDPYPGNCPYHGDCLEGLASGPAIQSRWKKTAAELEPGHPAWALEAHYLALGLVNLTLALSPQRILFGGGVMQQPRLFEGIRQEFARLLHGYVRHRELDNRLERYIQPAGLGGRAGVLGALILAERQVRQ